MRLLCLKSCKSKFGSNAKPSWSNFKVAFFDKHSDLNKRSPMLMILIVLGCNIISVRGWISSGYRMQRFLENGVQTPCPEEPFMQILGWSIILYGFLGRCIRSYARIYVSYNQKKGIFNESSPVLTASTSTKSSFKILVHKPSDIKHSKTYDYIMECIAGSELYLVIPILLMTAVVLLLHLVLALNYDWFQDNDYACYFGVQHYLLMVYTGIAMFILLPISFVYHLYSPKDGFNLSIEALIVTGFGAPCYLVFLIISITIKPKVGIDEYLYNTWVIADVFAMIVNAAVVLLSLFWEFIDKPSVVQMTFDEFLKDCAAKEFSTENVIFWESYEYLMRECLVEITRENPGFNVPLSLFVLGKNLQNAPSFPLTTKIARYIMLMHENFLVVDSSYELNVKVSARNQVSNAITAIENFMPAIKLKNEKIDDCFITFDKTYTVKTENDILYISIFLFDEIKTSVLRMIFENTFPQFLKTYRKASVASLGS